MRIMTSDDERDGDGLWSIILNTTQRIDHREEDLVHMPFVTSKSKKILDMSMLIGQSRIGHFYTYLASQRIPSRSTSRAAVVGIAITPSIFILIGFQASG